MVPDGGLDNGNGRVTLAVVQNEIRHLCQKQDDRHNEILDALARMERDMRERTNDHEVRIRSLEGADRQGIWRDLGTLGAAIAAGIIGWFGK
jgi:hypothetical protein